MTRPTTSSSSGSGSLAARAILATCLATCLIAGAGLALGGACSNAPASSDAGGTGTGGKSNGSGGVGLGTGGSSGGGTGGSPGAGGTGAGGTTGAGGSSACSTATANTLCNVEGTKCSVGCTDACSFCNLLSCTGGHWVQLESVPAPCFNCGPSLRCRIGVQLCSETLGGAVGNPPQYVCSALPDRCQSTPTCACVAPPPSTCAESGTGQLTVTTYAP